MRTAVIACVALAWLPPAVGALVGYFGVLAPLQEKVVAEEAGGLVRELDGIVRARSLALDVATRNLQLRDFRESVELDKLLQFMLRHFPDFVRVDVLDRSGKVAAMAGELQISAAGLPSHMNISRLAGTDSGGRENGWTFLDEPEENRYSVVCKRGEETEDDWFIRAQFSRDPITEALGSLAKTVGLTARLVQRSERITWDPTPAMSPGRTGAGTVPSRSKGEVTTSGFTLWGAVSADARLAAPGWLLSVKSGPSLLRSPLFVPTLLAIHLALVFLAVSGIGRFAGEGAQDSEDLRAGHEESCEEAAAETDEDDLLGPLDQSGPARDRGTDRDEFGADPALIGDSPEESPPDRRDFDYMLVGERSAFSSEPSASTEFAAAGEGGSDPADWSGLPWFEILEEEDSGSVMKVARAEVPDGEDGPDYDPLDCALPHPDWIEDPEPETPMTLEWDADRKTYVRRPSRYAGA
jgi:hypothetical protein